MANVLIPYPKKSAHWLFLYVAYWLTIIDEIQESVF